MEVKEVKVKNKQWNRGALKENRTKRKERNDQRKLVRVIYSSKDNKEYWIYTEQQYHHKEKL